MWRYSGTLWAFANALELGVDALEMDTVFTKDGIVGAEVDPGHCRLTDCIQHNSLSSGMITKFWQQNAGIQSQGPNTLEKWVIQPSGFLGKYLTINFSTLPI